MIRYMEIGESAFEIEVRIYDTYLGTLFIKNFHMVGTENKYIDVLEFCYDMAFLRMVGEIRIIGTGNRHTYDYLVSKTHEHDTWHGKISVYNISRL